MIYQISLFSRFLLLLNMPQTRQSDVVSTRLFFRLGKDQKSPSVVPIDLDPTEAPEDFTTEIDEVFEPEAIDSPEDAGSEDITEIEIVDSADSIESVDDFEEVSWDPLAKESELSEVLEEAPADLEKLVASDEEDVVVEDTEEIAEVAEIAEIANSEEVETVSEVSNEEPEISAVNSEVIGADGADGLDGESGDSLDNSDDADNGAIAEDLASADLVDKTLDEDVVETGDEAIEPVAGLEETDPIAESEDELEEEIEIEDIANTDQEEEEESEEEETDENILVETPVFLADVTSGIGVVTDPSGKLSFIWKYDGGAYEGQVGVVSTVGLEGYDLNSIEFMQEAIRRALANIVVNDTTEGAEFSGNMGDGASNHGAFTGEKTVQLAVGEQFFLALIPNGRFTDVLANLEKGDLPTGDLRPLFSLATANPEDMEHFAQLVDLTGVGTTFAIEDIRGDEGSDWDLNDVIVRIKGADLDAATINDLIDSGVISEAPKWMETDLGKAVLAAKGLPGDPVHSALPAPTVPQTTVDQGGNGFADLAGVNNGTFQPNRGGALPNTPTALEYSATQDIIDQVSGIDPTDIYQVDSQHLKQAEISVLSGSTSVSLVTLEGEVLSQKVLGRGTHAFTIPDNVSGEVLLKFDNHGGTDGTYILKGFESQAEEPFNIDLEFTGGVTASQQEVIRAAAKSIEALIGKGLPSAIVDGKIIDDINFQISAKNLDGVGGTLARTKIDFMRYGTMLPAQSITQFDVNDIAELEKSGELFSVVQHEILHGLGFGNLWEAKGLVDYAGTPLAQYNGRQAVNEFNNLGGLSNTISLEANGNGSAGLHWDEALFQDELMTYDLGFKQGADGQVFSPISAVTIASLADLGYRVNLDRANPDFGLFGLKRLKPEDLTSEQMEAFRKLAEESIASKAGEFIPAIPVLDPDKVAPEIWAHAEKFWKNGEYYEWQDYRIPSGDTLSHIALRYLGSAGYDYYAWIGDHNGVANYNQIGAGDWIKVPILQPDYEQKQEAERVKRQQELKDKQDREAQDQRDQQDRLDNDKSEQDRFREDQERRDQEARDNQRALDEQAQRLKEQRERRLREKEEYEREQARLAALARLAEIARQQGKGGQEWFFAKPMPEFGPVDPFETSMTGETVGNLVPDDYYRFTLSRGGRITAELLRLLADADLVLYDVRNEPIAYSMREGVTDEQIIADLIPGTYMLRVNSPKGVTTDYDLVVKFQHKLSLTQTGFPIGWRPTTVGGNPKTPLHANPTEANPLRGFLHPLNGSGTVTQGNGGSTSHTGRAQYAIDYGVPIGTPVYAMRSGTVVGVVDKHPDTGGGYENRNNFNYVLIEHDGGYRSAYLHLQQGSNSRIGLKVGDTVNAGQLIGYSGNSGWSTGPHLHVEVHKPAGGYFGQTVPFVIGGDAAGDNDSAKDNNPKTKDDSISNEVDDEYFYDYVEDDRGESVKDWSNERKLNAVVDHIKEYVIEYAKGLGEDALNDIISSFNEIIDDIKKFPDINWQALATKIFDFVAAKVLGRTPIGRAVLAIGRGKSPSEILSEIMGFIQNPDIGKLWEEAKKLFEDGTKLLGDLWNSINKLVGDAQNLPNSLSDAETEADLDEKGEKFVEASASPLLGLLGNLIIGKVGPKSPDLNWNKNKKQENSKKRSVVKFRARRNVGFAGKNHPVTGVPFDKDGYPDFSQWTLKRVKIEFTGSRAKDVKLANEASGYTSTPIGYIWHHNQDGKTMELVEREIHVKTGHDGGFAGN